MFKNKKVLFVVALIVVCVIGTTVYATVAKSNLVSSMIPLGAITNVAWSGDQDNETIIGNTPCPIEGTTCQSDKRDDVFSNLNSEDPWMGVDVTTIHKALFAHVPGMSGLSHGVMIEKVADDSPAMNAGLKQYDLITQINDTIVDSPEHLAELVKSSKVGDEISVTCMRQGTEVGVKVKLKANPNVAQTANLTIPWFKNLGTPDFNIDWFDTNWFETNWSALNAAPNVSTTNSTPKSWSESQSMKMSRNSNGSYDVTIEYQKNGDSVERTFKGTRDEVLKGINEDEELPETLKERLKGSLTEESLKPGVLAKEMASKIKEQFDKPFLDNGILDSDPFGDSWFGKNWIQDDWINHDWFKGPSFLNQEMINDLGRLGGSDQQPNDSP